MLRVTLGESVAGARHVARVEVWSRDRWQAILHGVPGRELCTSAGGADGGGDTGPLELRPGESRRLAAAADAWEAVQTLELQRDGALLVRRQTYRARVGGRLALHPGFRLRADPAVRYTYPLHAHDRPLAALPAFRVAVDWALPFPFHVWHTGEWVALYGLDKRHSPGTLDFQPADGEGWAGLRVYWPERGEPRPDFFGAPAPPAQGALRAGEEVTLTELVAACQLEAGAEPLLEAVRLAAGLLLEDPPRSAPLEEVADGIARFYHHCQLWEPDALGAGRGWFSNMWVRTQTGPARRRGEMSGYYDLGWGEGIAVETMAGLVAHWRRTGRADLLPYVDEMSRNIECFRRAPGDDQPFFDRSDGRRFGDFLMDVQPGHRIWTHSLGHLGSQLLKLHERFPDYPQAATRQAWLAAGASCARFLASRQRADGDLNDIYDAEDREANPKPHRIAARAVACGLWTRYARLAGDGAWVDRALRLARAVAPELARFDFYNQMIDGIGAPDVEFVDGEAAYYVLEGLVPLFGATGDPQVLNGCRQAAAFGLSWTYFYDLPHAHGGVARGGQCCRMPDFPLLYPIGPAKAVRPLLELSTLTGDGLYRTMAGEMVAFLSHWQLRAPGQPWDGGMLHAQAQYDGRHWGPDLAGQVDTGMATGNSLAAIEAWLAAT